ncbi:MAG: acyl-CoA/acyl-ACP dehydrogenase [Dehalococcoidia bacterium]|nr:acyl-CoA/acyl-ACP dehydrogenase [Dehalococcoidia bacterium]
MTEVRDALRQLLPAIAEREAADPDAFPRETIAELYRAGVPSAPFAKALGGAGCGLPDAAELVEMLAGASASAALVIAMPLGLAGVYDAIVPVVPDHERAAFLRQVEEVAADFAASRIYAACNSERGAGGSLAATKAFVERADEGTIRISGEKILASSGRDAYRFFSTAQVPPGLIDGAAAVEFFLVPTTAAGVEVVEDWDGFGMRSTASHTVRYARAPVDALMCFPNLLAVAQPLQYFYVLFAAVSLGAAGAMLRALGEPAPSSPALRQRLVDAGMRFEALRAYLFETAALFRPAAGPAYAARVLRTKTFVTQDATKLAAELFALSGGRHYRRGSPLARAFADSFAGTALRPPLQLGLDTLLDDFALPTFD